MFTEYKLLSETEEQQPKKHISNGVMHPLNMLLSLLYPVTLNACCGSDFQVLFETLFPLSSHRWSFSLYNLFLPNLKYLLTPKIELVLFRDAGLVLSRFDNTGKCNDWTEFASQHSSIYTTAWTSMTLQVSYQKWFTNRNKCKSPRFILQSVIIENALFI